MHSDTTSQSDVPHVVYHVAAMGNWNFVIGEQLLALRLSGLSDALKKIGDAVNVTYVGDLQHIRYLQDEADRMDVPIRIVRSDAQVLHYETFAMLEIERLAKEENTSRPILYFHTKGVSNTRDATKADWRRVMQNCVIDKWRENVEILKRGYDAAGWNWHYRNEQHFSGTFWIAKADLIRRLPSFVAYHHHKNLVRYSCELWIGTTGDCVPYNYGPNDRITWDNGFDYRPYLTPIETTITWITAATPKYINKLCGLSHSFVNLGPQHKLVSVMVPDTAWRHCYKLSVIESVLPSVTTPYVFWIDADCHFLCQLHHTDLTHPDFAVSCLNHFGYDHPSDGIPARLMNRVPSSANGYHQACLFGGTVDGMRDLLKRTAWIHTDERGYDEHALNIDFYSHPVFTIPCRYGAPNSFANIEQYRAGYERKAQGAAKIIHENCEVTGQ